MIAIALALVISTWHYTIIEPSSEGQGGPFQTSADCLKEAQHWVLEKPADIECYQVGPSGERIRGTTVRLHVPQKKSSERQICPDGPSI